MFSDDGKGVDKKARDGDEDENNVEHRSGYEKSGVRLAWFGLENNLSVSVHAGSGLVPAALGTVN